MARWLDGGVVLLGLLLLAASFQPWYSEAWAWLGVSVLALELCAAVAAFGAGPGRALLRTARRAG